MKIRQCSPFSLPSKMVVILSLQELNLQNNHLTDGHIRNLTAPLRMFNKSASELKVLDLSCK